MKTEAVSKKIELIALIVLAFFLLLVARLWQLQILEGKDFKRASFENRLRIEKLPSSRGIIHDRNGRPLVKNSPYYYVALQPEMLGTADLGSIAEFLSMGLSELHDIILNNKDPFEPIKLKGGLDFEEVAFMEARLSDYPGLVITAEQTRHYLFGEVGAHILGYLGKLSPSQIKKADFREVPRQAFIGQWGLEKMFDSYLRGEPGKKAIEVDALGRPLRLIKEEAPDRGNDLYLSIDLDLQMEAEKAFGEKVGALVAIKPHTGEILALVSRPSFDPNLFSRGIDYSDWLSLAEHKSYPMLNRALQSQFPPGSTFKIVTAIAALESGAITPDTRSTCTGLLRMGRWRFRCWRRGGHGTLSLHRAIVESCDVYFYRAGDRAGIDNIAKYARMLGLESESGLMLVKEKSGLIPDTKWKERVKNQPWFRGETLNAAIGQGYVLVTPVQLARMTAAISNGGYLYDLRLTRAESQPVPVSKLDVRAETLRDIKEALRGVVSERRGTGYAARSRIVDIAGKTGTAQVISQRDRDYKEEETPEELRDHAWFVAFAPVENPEIAVAVFVEHGGHGGAAAAPIAKRAIETYIRKINDTEQVRAPESHEDEKAAVQEETAAGPAPSGAQPGAAPAPEAMDGPPEEPGIETAPAPAAAPEAMDSPPEEPGIETAPVPAAAPGDITGPAGVQRDEDLRKPADGTGEGDAEPAAQEAPGED
jgi:penicillin-binding protein 2